MSLCFDSIIDARGVPFHLLERPVRIVSLVPSITELLFDLGYSERDIVGRTKFCVHPRSRIDRIPVVGGTKTVHIEKLRSLSPDLVIANIDENQKELIEELESGSTAIPVFVTHPRTIADSVRMIAELGALLHAETASEELIFRLRAVIETLSGTREGRALYLIWRRPYMTIAPDTYIHDLLSHIGYRNVIDEQWLLRRTHTSAGAGRYPSLSIREIAELNPDVVLFSSEPFPFAQRHIDEFLKTLGKCISKLPQCRLVDGEVYSWYGSRLVNSQRPEF